MDEVKQGPLPAVPPRAPGPRERSDIMEEASTVRERTQEIERATLAPWAMLSQNSAGRDVPELECPIRTLYQRDRDRIIHCNAYRRLMHKTQVFLFPQGDHYRTRLTHTLEVSQIARTIARGLRLNEDLTEAIAMGHDLGHTPFGHAGEYALREVSPIYFQHSEQSVRVVEKLEKDGRGLNLTKEVRDGILRHSDNLPWAQTLEGRVVRYADKIAYINHDIEDAIRGGILTEEDLPWDIKVNLGATKSLRISRLVGSLIQNSGGDGIGMDAETEGYYKALKTFLFDTVYTDPVAKGEEGKARDIVKKLYEYYVAHPQKLPEDYAVIREEEGVERAAVDYIAGMSDRFCVGAYEALFIPQPWAR